MPRTLNPDADNGALQISSTLEETSAIAVAGNVYTSEPPRDPRGIHATPHIGGFFIIAAQLAGLLLVFFLYHLETSRFMYMSALTFAAFLFHYWLPFRFKEAFWVAVSLAGGTWLVGPRIAALVIAIGFGFFLILRSPARFLWRVSLVSAIFALLIYGCATSKLPIPTAFYSTFGAIFMFRIVIYVYDLAYAKEPPRLLPFLSYFYLLPNFYFVLFPVIDFQTMRTTYYRRDIHKIAQQGIHWMARGAIQLMLYRLVLYFNDPYLPDRVNSLGALLTTTELTFLLYLNVSGTFHMIVGMLHLFGYDLPETHRGWLLANSFLDFWRRINIYWKDFMVKVVYFPVYFKLRKKGELRAQLTATVAVFLVSWFLHSYQYFWLEGRFVLTWNDTIFWTCLGILVMANVLYDRWRPRKKKIPSWPGHALWAAQVLGTNLVITTLWLLWSSPSLSAWLYLVSHWAQRG